MGQVPEKAALARAPSYGIVGSGRMARHTRAYFDQLGIRYQSWSRRGGGDPSEALHESSVILLLISDSAIEGFIRANPFLAGKTLVHFSGSLVTELAAGAHPLMTFGPELLAPEAYQCIHFVYERDRLDFRRVFPLLPNPAHPIRAEDKSLYHALCVLSGNFTVVVWQKLFHELQERMGIPREAAVPYLEQIARNLAQDPARALTGPFQRRDARTIRSNLSALSGDPFEAVYRAFARLLLPEALEETSNPSTPGGSIHEHP